jgi:chromate reductase
MHILGFSGSFRRASWNSGLLRAAQTLAPEGMHITIADYSDLPFFSQDLEATPPQAALTLRDQIQGADGLLFAIPEYNYSLPGGFKNMIDWMSRMKPAHPFNHKVGALMGAGGRVGTARAQLHFRQIAAYLNITLVNKPEVIVTFGSEKFDMVGNLIDEGTKPLIRDSLTNLATLINKLNS